MLMTRLFASILFLCCFTNSLNTRPIIGVFTQPSTKALRPAGEAYIAASYVKYLESAGARVVPILHTSTQAQLKELFNSINGILYPGGSSRLGPTTQYYQAAYFMYRLALEANDRGDYFPIQGTCLGFELLHLMTSQNSSLLGWVDAENITLPLRFESGFETSRLFSNAPQQIVSILGSQPVTMNNHMRAIFKQDYQLNPSLDQFYKILSTNKDRNNLTFISTVEARNYPIYAYQWHPEKPQFEWDPKEVIQHTEEAIKSMQYFSSFFVSEARKNNHKFPSKEAEAKALIYGFPVTDTRELLHNFEQCYVFKV